MPLKICQSSARPCGHSSHPNHAGRDGDEGCIGRDGLVVSGGNPAKVLDLVDEAFDEMALFVHERLALDGITAVMLR